MNEKDTECIHCKLVAGELPIFKVYEDAHVLCFLDVMRATDGHTLVVPKVHYADMFTVPQEELAQVAIAIQKTAMLLRERLGCEGVNILNASGVAAQQSVFHLHFHILPRWKNDGVDAWLKSASDKPASREEIYKKITGG